MRQGKGLPIFLFPGRVDYSHLSLATSTCKYAVIIAQLGDSLQCGHGRQMVRDSELDFRLIDQTWH